MDSIFQIDNVGAVRDIAKTVQHATSWRANVIVDVTLNGRDCSVNVSLQQPLFLIYNKVYLNADQVKSTGRHVENVTF